MDAKLAKDALRQLKGLNRANYRISWDQKWLMHAQISSARSHDSRTQCGCVLVRDNQMLSEGYNGHLRDIQDDVLPNYEGNDDPIKSKYTYMIHAEINSIINAARNGVKVIGAYAYVTHKPCPQCYQYLWQAGISKIFIPKNHKPTKGGGSANFEGQLNILDILLEGRLSIEEIDL